MDRASMLSLKRRLSSLSLRQKTPNDSGSNGMPNINGEGGLIRADLPGSQEAVAQLPLAHSTGTITPLINGIRDIIEDVLPMPSARHVPPDLQRRLSTLPSAQDSHSQQPSGSWDSRQTRLQNDLETWSADVLVIEDGPVMPARKGMAVRGRQDPISQPSQNSEAQQVLPSENSLVWDLPQLASTSSSRPRTQGARRPQSGALTSASQAVRPRSKQIQTAKIDRYGSESFSAASSAQGSGASAQVLKVDQSRGRGCANSKLAPDGQKAAQSRRKQSLVHLQQRGRERRSSQTIGLYPNIADEGGQINQTLSASSTLEHRTASPAVLLARSKQRSQQGILPSRPSAVPKKSAAEGPGSSKASKWKQQSAQLRLAMQANKGGSSGEAAAAMLAETNQASLVPCPHCGRSFSEVAAERHIPKCQDIVHKPSRLVAGGGTGAHQRVQNSRR